MINTLRPATALVLLTISAASQAYQTEVSGDIERISDDRTREDTYTIAARYYLSDVNNSDSPYAQQAFLQRKSHADIAVSQQSEEYKHWDIDNSGQEIMASLHFIPGGTPVILNAGAAITNRDGTEEDMETTDTHKQWAVGAGAYIDQNSAIRLSYANVLSYSSTTEPSRLDAYYYRSQMAKVDGRTILEVAGSSLDIKASASRVKRSEFGEEDYWTWLDSSADYYFNKQLSAGITLERIYGYSVQTGFGIQGQYFFNPTLAVNASLNRTNSARDSDSPERTFKAGITARF